MTSERAQAYGRVMKHLEELGDAKLRADEQARVREAADTLLFCEDPTGAEAGEALADVETLVDNLLDADRITDERARRLIDDLSACGPLTRV
jgi:hypothetical protein